METSPAPAPAGTDPARALHGLIADPAPLGIEVLPLGTGPLSVAEGAQGALAVDRNGHLVLIAAVARIEPGTAAGLSDELDRAARMELSDLQQLTEHPDADLQEQHAERFGTSERTRLNSDQQVILLVGTDPSEKEWKQLVVELGPRLRSVHRFGSGGSVEAVQPPAALQRAPRQGGWRGSSWLALAAVLLGVGLLLLGLARVLLVEDEQPPQAVDSPIRTVASGVPGDATHGNWIAQQHAVVDTRGRIMLLYRTDSGLQLAVDERNRGRSWRAPVTVSDLAPASFSMDVDLEDDLHVALLDEGLPRVMTLQQTPTGWEASDPVDLGEVRSESAVIDIAWDVGADTGYVVWTEPLDEGGEELRWAALSESDNGLKIDAEGSVTQAPDGPPILANVGVGGDSTLIVTYRGPDGRWFSRLGEIRPPDRGKAGPRKRNKADSRKRNKTGPRKRKKADRPKRGGADPQKQGNVKWQPEETVPAEGGIGGAALVVDKESIAHLLLRNDEGPRLEYFRRSLRGGWSSGEEVADAASIEGVDLPALSVDSESRLVYAFFQTDAGVGGSQVQVAFRDPASGWEGPYDVAPPTVVPEGSGFPATTEIAAGEPLVFWTTGGRTPSVQSARVVAP